MASAARANAAAGSDVQDAQVSRRAGCPRATGGWSDLASAGRASLVAGIHLARTIDARCCGRGFSPDAFPGNLQSVGAEAPPTEAVAHQLGRTRGTRDAKCLSQGHTAPPAARGQSMHKFLRNHRGFIAFLLAFGVFRTCLADWNPVPTGSMRPTIQEGDVVLVDRTAYSLKVPLTDHVLARLGEPARGDIVVFSSPTDGTRLVKRLVAIPGDRVEMRARQLRINGEPALYSDGSWVSERVGDG